MTREKEPTLKDVSIDTRSVTLGLILAGGRGVRLGKKDKALLDYAGQPLIAWACHILRSQTGALLITRQKDQVDLSKFGAVLFDTSADQGPLAALLGGINYARNAGYRFIVTIPVDCPHLPKDLVRRLFRVRKPHAVLSLGGRDEPTIALYDIEAMEMATHAFETGKRALKSWMTHTNFGRFEALPHEADSYLNINRLGDLR